MAEHQPKIKGNILNDKKITPLWSASGAEAGGGYFFSNACVTLFVQFKKNDRLFSMLTTLSLPFRIKYVSSIQMKKK